MCDWLPTFFRLADGKPERLPEDLDGFDIWDSISKGTPSPRTEMFIQADPNFGDYAYRWKQYKVMHYETPLIYLPDLINGTAAVGSTSWRIPSDY